MNIKKFLLSAVAFVAATAAFADGQLSVPAYTAEELQDNVAMYLKLGKNFMKRDFTLAETPSEPIRVNLDGKEFVKYHDTDESQKDFYLRDRYIAKATIEFSSYVYGYTTDPSAGVGEASYESFVNGGEAYFIAKKNAKAIAYQFSFLTGKDIPVYLLNEDGKATFADYGHNDSYNVTFITLAQKNYVDAINAANEAIKDIPASFQAVDKTNWDKMVAAATATDEEWADNQAALEAALAAYKANYGTWKAAQDDLAADEIYNGTLDEMKVDGKPFPFKAGNYEKIGEKAAEKDIKDFAAWETELFDLVNHYNGGKSKMNGEYQLYTAEVDKVQAKIDELGYKGSVYDELVEQIDWKKHEEKVGMHNDKSEVCPIDSWIQYVDDLLDQYKAAYNYIGVQPKGLKFAPNKLGLVHDFRAYAVEGDDMTASILALNDDPFSKASAKAFEITPTKATAAGLDMHVETYDVFVGYEEEPSATFVNQFGQIVNVYEPIYEEVNDTTYGATGVDFTVKFTPENGGLGKDLIFPLDYTRSYTAKAQVNIEGVKKNVALKGYNPALSWEMSQLNQEIEDTYPTADEEIRVYPFVSAGYDNDGMFEKVMPFAWTDNPNIKAFVQPAHVKDVVKEDITIKGGEFTDPWGNKVVVEDRVIEKGTEYWRPIKPEEELEEGIHSYELVVITKATDDQDVRKSHVWVKDNWKGSLLTLNIMPIRHRIYANTNPIHFPYNGGMETIGIDYEGFIGHTNSNYSGMLYDRDNWNTVIGASDNKIFDINFIRSNESTEKHNSVVLNGRGSLEAEITCWPAKPGNYGVEEGNISIACDHETLNIPVTRTYPHVVWVNKNTPDENGNINDDPTTPNVDESSTDIIVNLGGENPDYYNHEIEIAVKDMINCYDMKDDLEITVDNNQFEVTNSSRWFDKDGMAFITVNINYIPCDPHEVVTAIVTVKVPGYNDKEDNVLRIPVKGIAGSAAVVAAVKGGNIDGISNVTVNGAAKTVYTISGARANNATKGIVIENGAKVAKK